MTFSPYAIQLLLKYYVSGIEPDHPPVWASTVATFVEMNLLEEVPEAERLNPDEDSLYRVTPTGKRHVEGILSMPILSVRGPRP